MIKVLFICHGNICRSPMAEYVFKKMVSDEGLESEFMIASAGTSNEECGNPVYPPVRNLLNKEGINCASHRALRIDKADYNRYDLLICMDSFNVRNLMRIVGSDPEHKIHLLLEYARGAGYEKHQESNDVDDPYYSGDYNAVSEDIHAGCRALLDQLKKEIYI